MKAAVQFVQIVMTKSVEVNMKFLVGVERQDYLSGIIDKEVEADEFVIDSVTRVLYFYKKNTTIAAFLEWEYVRLADEEA
jgi:hypothetical protein